MREEIDLASLYDATQIGMRRGSCLGLCLVIHQSNQSRVSPVRKSRPVFNPILDLQRQFGITGKGKVQRFGLASLQELTLALLLASLQPYDI